MNKSEKRMPRKGMNRHTHPSELQQNEYSFAYNANIQDEHGDGDYILLNEPSNLKCSGFKEGFVVLKHKYDNVNNVIYFFLVNPLTGCSEIGSISASENFEPNQVVERLCKCDAFAVEETPLEDVLQEDLCEYTTIISDYCELTDPPSCTGCLNFSTKFPILDVQIRHSALGTEIYWNDANNPDRYIKLYDLDNYVQDVDDCSGEITPTCLQCDKLDVFNKYGFPCLRAESVDGGGNLRMGIYEIDITYSDVDGTELSDHFPAVNPVSIFDRNNTILDQTQLDSYTNQSIRVEVSNLDQDYDYYKVTVFFRSGNNPNFQYRTYAVYPISQTSFTISEMSKVEESNSDMVESSNRVNEFDILNQRPFYMNSGIMSTINGHMFLGDITARREINLQPVVNLMGFAARWGTVLAKERLYRDGSSVSNYKGYMRDEVVPYGIVFQFDGGWRSALFPIIPRPPLDSEIATMPDDTNKLSIDEYIDECSDNPRTQVWQYLNTGTVIGECPGSPSGDGVPIEVESSNTCITETEITVGPGVIPFDFEQTIGEWVLDPANYATIQDPANTDLVDIADAIDNTDYAQYGDCTVDVGDTCTDPVLVSEEIVILSVLGEAVGQVSIPQNQYDPVQPADSCEFLVEPDTHDVPVETVLGPGSTVWLKTPITNTTCSLAESTFDFLPGQGGPGWHLVDMSTTGPISDLYDTSIPVSQTGPGYFPFLHDNAAWFKGSFIASERIIFELSPIECVRTDDNTNNSVRVSVFYGCPNLVEVPVYSRIITDMTTPNDPQKFFDFSIADFPGQSPMVYIAIDSPMYSNYVVQVTFSGTSGTGNVVIEGVNYPAVFNTDATTTASDFFTVNSAALSLAGMTPAFGGGVLTIAMNFEQYDSLEWNNLTGDLNATFTLVSQGHTLQPPCGCFAVYKREVVLRTIKVYDSITFAKRQLYEYTCTYIKIKVTDCDPAPDQYGLFSYWQSELKYPCNPELFDSTTLTIGIDDIPLEYRDEFEDYYVTGTAGGNYVLGTSANFMDQPIRHFKYPDSSVIPFMEASDTNFNDLKDTDAFIRPIGFMLDNDIINTFLDVAVKSGLLTQEERDSITGYEIFRGDRANERSIVAKGLINDMRFYDDKSREGFEDTTTYYPNYPLNDQSAIDNLNGAGGKVDMSFFSFHSPDTSFNFPSLPYEMGVEGYQFGVSLNKFSYVEDHVEWILLGKKARNLAMGLAAAEFAFELLMNISDVLVLAGTGGISVIVAAVLAAVAVIGIAFTAPYRIGKYKYEWLTIFENFGTPMNFAYYGIAEGIYKSFQPNDVANSKLRGLSLSHYIKSGRLTVLDEKIGETLYVNNYKRENSVLVRMGEAFKLTPVTGYAGYDNSAFNIPTKQTGILGDYTNKAASPYVSLKRYRPNQYGSINSVDWLPTGYCGRLDEDNTCSIVFGGDTFISRFSPKIKMPFFTDIAINLPPGTPYKYSSKFNLNNGNRDSRGYLDYKTSDDNMLAGYFQIPENKSEYTLWNGNSWVDGDINQFYVKDEYKFLVGYYGFPYFLVESEYNCNNRYAKRELFENFYPNVGDVIEYTQETNVPMSKEHLFLYNGVYSARPHKRAYRLLPINFSRIVADKQNDYSNALAYSDQDDSSSARTRSPWLNFRPGNVHVFNKEYGSLVDARGIENELIWVRFTNGYEIYNSVDPLRERLTENNRRVGLGGIFNNRALSFNKTTLGYNGTQHKASISTEFGHYSVDAMRGKVFEMQPGGKGVNEISLSMDKWFKEQLPFKLLKYFPDVKIDDAYNGLGISMGWDDRTKRLFLTKLDYIPKSGLGIQWSEEDGFYITEGEELIPISLTDTDYFDKAHWTVAYSPLTKSWISYYAFHPFYYISLDDHFKTGLNILGDTKHGLWSHYPLVSSYQVFYGERHPFIVEFSTGSIFERGKMNSLAFWLDSRKYTNLYDFSDKVGTGFDKLYIYNNFQNSGKLNLIFNKYNDRRLSLKYPKFNSDSIDITQTEYEGKWQINQFWNIVKNEKSGLPIWLNDNVNVLKTLNPPTLDYRATRKDMLLGDYFLNRLENTLESRYRMMFRVADFERSNYS